MKINSISANTQYINNSVNAQNCNFQGLKNIKYAERAIEHRKMPSKEPVKFADMITRFLLKLFHLPTSNNIDYVRSIINQFNQFNHPYVENKDIEFILDMLEANAKNPEYSNFVKEGIRFFLKNKNNRALYCKNLGSSTLCHLDTAGSDLRFTIGSAFEKAVRPNSKWVNEKTLQRNIEKSREYMAAFTEKGERIFPDGFILTANK